MVHQGVQIEGHVLAAICHASVVRGRLWNLSRDNMSCLKGDRARPRAPDLAGFLAPVIMEMDPEEGIEEQYKVRACTVSLPAVSGGCHGPWRALQAQAGRYLEVPWHTYAILCYLLELSLHVSYGGVWGSCHRDLVGPSKRRRRRCMMLWPGVQIKRDPVYSWKALRQISRASLQTFSKMLNPAAAAKQRPGPGGSAKPGGAGLPTSAEAARKEAPAAKLDLENAVHELYPVCSC